jgi:hypothetical protein
LKEIAEAKQFIKIESTVGVLEVTADHVMIIG